MKSFSACPAWCVLMTAAALVLMGHLVACAEVETGNDVQPQPSNLPSDSATDTDDSLNEDSTSEEASGCEACADNQNCVDDACVCD